MNMASIPPNRITGTIVAVAVVGLIFQQSVTGQDPSVGCRSSRSVGREFIVGFLQILHLESTKEMHIAGSSRSHARITITAPDIFNSPHETDLTGSRQFKIVSLEDIPDTSSTAVLVQSTSDISVVGLVAGNNTGAFLALPTEALGTEYFVVTYNISTRLLKTKRGSEFIVIGTRDRTRVFIRFTGSVRYEGRVYDSGDSLTLSVNRLQIIRFMSKNSDLTGTHVIADHPVVVTSGSKCADVPLSKRYCDHIIEQMVPFQFWGSHFVTTPLALRTGGDIFRIVAGRNGTSVTICDTRPHSLDAGDVVERSLPSNTSCAISSSRPVLVLQYSKGATSDRSNADPSMMIVPALEQFVTEALFAMPDISLRITSVESLVNVVVQCELLPFLMRNMFTVPSSSFAGSFNVTIAGRNMCSAQIPLESQGHNFFQFEDVPGDMSLVLYGNAAGDVATSFGLPVGFTFRDNSCFNLSNNYLTEPAALTDIPGTYRPTIPSRWGTAVGPSDPGNGNGLSGHNNLLAVSLIIVMVSLIVVTLLVGYVVILRKRVEVLETEKRNYSNVPVPHGPDGYIGLDGSQIAHRDYMTLNNSDELWHLNRRSDRSDRSHFRGVQGAYSVGSSDAPVPLHPLGRPQSVQSRSTSRGFERDTTELIPQDSTSRDPLTPSRKSSQSESFGNVNPSFCEVDSLSRSSVQDTISEISFQPTSLRTPTRPVRRHHSHVERFNTTTPVPKPRYHGPRGLRRSASTPDGDLWDNPMRVHYHVPRGARDPVFGYDRPRNRTNSEGPSPSAADILRPPEEMSSRSSRDIFRSTEASPGRGSRNLFGPPEEASSRCSRNIFGPLGETPNRDSRDVSRPSEEVSNLSSRESSSNESEGSLPPQQDDGYMSMKEARASTASKSSQSTVGGSPLKEVADEAYPDEYDHRKEQIDEDSTEYTELF